jgi:hypothetical protein
MSTPSPPEDTRGIRAVSTLSVISGRKVDFVTNALRRLHDLSHQNLERAPTSKELNNLEKELVEAVAELDWHLFVTTSEQTQRKLNLNTRLEDLNRQEIWTQIEKRLGKKLGLR